MAVRLSGEPQTSNPSGLRAATVVGRALLLAAVALAGMAPLAEARTPTTQGIMGYGLLNANLPNSRLWNGDPAVENFGSEFAAVDPATKDIGWVVVKANPVNPRDALLGALSANAGGTLYIYTWTYAAGGTGNWTLTWQTPVPTYVHRCFDIAYEGESGDAVVVYASSTTPTQLLYRSRVSGSWTGALAAGSPLAYSIRWVRARTKPTTGSNDIFVASVTKGAGVSALSLHALRWDGASNTSPGGSWGDQIRTAADPAQADYEPYDLGFETQSGRVHLIWGDKANPANILYRIFTPGTGWSTTEASAYNLGGAKTTNWVAAGSDPSSNRIAIGVVEATNELIFGAWDGSAWVTRPADEAVNDPHQRTITVRFDAMGGVARYVFSLKALSTTFNYRTWDGTSFSAISSLGGTTSQPIRFMALKAHPTRNIMMALYSEQGGGLYHRYWNGEAATPYWSPAATLSTNWAGTSKLNETNQ